MASLNHDDEGLYQEGDRPVPGYTLVRLLGRGSSGEAWQVRSDDGNDAALKIVNLRNQSRLQVRELDAIRKLKNAKHNCLVGTHHVWLKDRDGNLRDTDGRIIDWAAYAKNPPPIAKVLPPVSPHGTASGGSSKPFAPQRTVTQPESPGPPVGATIGGEDLSSDSHSSDTNPSPIPPPTEYYESTKPKTGSTGSSGGDIAISREVRKSLTELFIVMSLGETTLGGLLSREKAKGNKGIPFALLRQFMHDAARGIDFLNQDLKLQHCDIKPENILIIANGAQICDCGLARETVLDQGATSLLNGLTREYAAPEQFKRREQNYGQGTDQYSLANTYYVLRTGTNIFKPNADEWEIKAAKCSGKIDLSSPLIGRYERLALERGLAVDPRKRYGSAVEMVESVIKGRELDCRPRSKWKPLLAVAALLLLAVLATAGVLWGPQIVQSIAALQSTARSPELAKVQEAVEDEDLQLIRTRYQQLSPDQMGDANRLLVAWLEPRGQRLAALPCDELLKLKSACQTVDGLFKEHGQNTTEAQRLAVTNLLTVISDLESAGIPAEVKSQLDLHLNQGEWSLALKLADDPAVAGGSACAAAKQDALREQVFTRWLTAVGELPLESRLAAIQALEEQLQAQQFVEKFKPKTSLVRFRQQQHEELNAAAQAVLKREDADWSSALQRWQLILDDQEYHVAQPPQLPLSSAEEANAQRLLTEARLGRLLVEARQNLTKPWQPADPNALLELSATTAPDSPQQARAQLLICLAAWPALDSAQVTANQVTEFLGNLERLSTLRAELTPWEEARFQQMITALSDRIGSATSSPAIQPEVRQSLNLALGRLLPDRRLTTLFEQAEKQLQDSAQIHQVQGTLAEIAGLLKDEASLSLDGNLLKRWQGQQQALEQWAKLVQGGIDAGQFPSFYAAVSSEDASVYHAGISAALVAQGRRSPDNLSLLIDRLHEQADAQTMPLAYAQALDQLLVLQLQSALLEASKWELIARDADWILESSQANTNRELSNATIAAAWLEAQCQLQRRQKPATSAWNDRVLAAKENTSPTDEWKTYRLYVLALERQSLPSAEAAASTTFLKPLTTTLQQEPHLDQGSPGWLQATSRRLELAKMLWSLAQPQVPNDDTLLKPTAKPKLLDAQLALQLAQDLVSGKMAKEDAAKQLYIRILASRTLLEYALPAEERRQSPTQLAKQANDLLTSPTAAKELTKPDAGPPLLQALRYHAVLGEIAAYSKSPPPAGWSPELERLVVNAANVVQFVYKFDFLAASGESDRDVYQFVVGPILKFVPTQNDKLQAMPTSVRPALAMLYAAQARLIERSPPVEAVLREEGLDIQQIAHRRRIAYEYALDLEVQPKQRSQIALHLGCLLEDLAGDFTDSERVQALQDALTSEQKDNLVEICAALPDYYGTQYLQGLRGLVVARQAAHDECDVSQSPEDLKRQYDAAVNALEAAVEQLANSPADSALYEVRFQLAVTTGFVERAYIEGELGDRERQKELLLEAIDHGDRAIVAAKATNNPRFRYQACIGRANACEDLAYYCKELFRFDEAKQYFQQAQEDAFLPEYEAEVLYHFGRSEYRRALVGMESSPAEARREVLKTAKDYLQKSIEKVKGIASPQTLEATNYLGDVCLEEAKLDIAGKSTAQQMLAAYRPDLTTEMLRHLGTVAEQKKTHHHADWGRCQMKYIDQIQSSYKFELNLGLQASSTALLTTAAKRRELLQQQVQIVLATLGESDHHVSARERARLLWSLYVLECSPGQRLPEPRDANPRQMLTLLKSHRPLFTTPPGCDALVIQQSHQWSGLFNIAYRGRQNPDICAACSEELRRIAADIKTHRMEDAKIVYFETLADAWQLLVKWEESPTLDVYERLLDVGLRLREQQGKLAVQNVPYLLANELGLPKYLLSHYKTASDAADSPAKLKTMRTAKTFFAPILAKLQDMQTPSSDVAEFRTRLSLVVDNLGTTVRSLEQKYPGN